MAKKAENLYDVLDVDRDATAEEIKAAYKLKAKNGHPDIGGDEEKFKAINHAYSVLSDPEKRKHYDETGENGNGNTITDAAVSHLKSMMLQAIKDNCDAKSTPTRRNEVGIVLTIDRCLKKQATDTHRQIAEAELLISRLKLEKHKVKLKAKAKDEFNLYSAVADDAINTAVKYLEAAKNQEEMLAIAAKILNNYEDVNVTSLLSADKLIERARSL